MFYLTKNDPEFSKNMRGGRNEKEERYQSKGIY